MCVLFKTSAEGGGRAGKNGGGGNQVMGSLVNHPLKNFSKLTGKDGELDVHVGTQFHLTCALRATEFLQRTDPCGNESADVRNQLSKAHKQEIEDNRSALQSIIDTVQVCAVQNIAFRGHRDDGPVGPTGDTPLTNDGNFRAMLRYRLRGGDEALKNI